MLTCRHRVVSSMSCLGTLVRLVDDTKLEEFAQLCGEDNTPLHKRFFERARDFFR